MITPQPGYIVDPNNSNGVIKDPGVQPANQAIIGNVPTSAPTGQTQVTQPPATPTPIVSSTPALDQTATAKTLVDTHNASLTAAQEALKAIPPPTPPAPPAPPAPPTPEQQLLNQGMRTVYDTATGEAKQIPVETAQTMSREQAQGLFGNNFTGVTQNSDGTFTADSNAMQRVNGGAMQGFSTVNPNGPAVATVQGTTSTYKQFSDGSYGRFDVNGTYTGKASADDFKLAQTASEINNKIAQISLGNFVLSPAEQAQIDSVTAIWHEEIRKQEVANANTTGAMGVFQMLHGGAGQVDTIGAIKGTIDQGIRIVGDLTNKMNNAILQMQDGFKTNDLNALNKAYNNYQQDQASRQASIKDMQDKVYQTQKAREQQEATAIEQTDTSIRRTILDAQAGGATPQQIATMNNALANHDYGSAILAGGDSLQKATGEAGQYYEYTKQAKAWNIANPDKQIAIMSPTEHRDWVTNQAGKDAAAQERLARITSGQNIAEMNRQDKLEQEFRTLLAKPSSVRSGDLGIQAQKVSQAIDLRTMMDQFKDGKTGSYDIPVTQYHELALGLAKLLSPTGQTGIELAKSLTQNSAQGDWAKFATYLTSNPVKGSSQQIFQVLRDSIDRQGAMSERLRDTQMTYLKNIGPTGLDPRRKAELMKAILPSYVNPERNVSDAESHPVVADQVQQQTKLANTSTTDLLSGILGNSTGGSSNTESFFKSLTPK